MSYLVHIPIAILNSITLLGLGWMLYKLIEINFQLRARIIFIIASLILWTATLSFILDISLLYTVFDVSIITPKQLVLSYWQYEYSNTISFLVGLCYCISILFLLIKMLFQFHKLNELKTHADYSFSDNFKNTIQNLTHLFPAKFKIGVAPNIQSPMVFGITETIILLPISCCNQLSTQEVKFILLHELAHILRKDYFINLFIEISNVMLWFNPFSYLIINEIHLQREVDCDCFVIENENYPILYSKTLLGIASKANNWQNGLTLGAIGNNKQLLKRIQKMNGVKVKMGGIKYKTGLLLVFILTLLIQFNYTVKPLNNQIANQLPLVETKQLAFNNVSAVSLLTKTTKVDKVSKTKTTSPASKIKVSNNRLNSTNKMDQDNLENENEVLPNESSITYSDVLKQTKEWLRNHQNSAQFANYNSVINSDSVENNVANVLLLASIVKSYQLKRTILEKQLSKTSNYNEANDYLMNSKEWEDVLQYEKWIEEFLRSHQ
jgi:beta-lactamase regulating signal transducer with metallopeptidase domain